MIPHNIQVLDNGSETYFEIWRGNERKIIPRPLDPYFWSITKLKDIKMAEITQEEKILLSTHMPKLLYKYSFPSVRYVKFQRSLDFTFEHDIPYETRVAINLPDFYRQFNIKKLPTVMFFDLEMLSKGLFPRPQREPIIGCGYAFNEEEPIIHLSKTDRDDSTILEIMAKDMMHRKPDIIVGYNSINFDLPYLITRFALNNLDITRLSKDNSLPHINYSKNKKYKGEKQQKIDSVSFGGITHIDLFHEVKMDQTLSGIKNRRMKTIAKWFKITNDKEDIKELDTFNMQKYVNDPKLYGYLRSDIIQTRNIYHIYANTIFNLSEELGIPLNMVANRSWNHIPRLVHGRGCFQRNIVGDLSNVAKYKPWHVKFSSHKSIEGARVKIFKNGFFKKTYKIDFKSFYPSLIRKFNLSPDVCYVIEMFPYNPKGFHYKLDEKNILHLYIPDKNIGRNVHIAVDQNTEGFLTKYLREMDEKRTFIRQKMAEYKNTDEKQYLTYFSRQWSNKIQQIVQWGYNGTSFATFGDLAVAIAITGLARYGIDMVEQLLPNHVIEEDTDGIYIDQFINIKLFNSLVNQIINKQFQVNLTEKLVLELDEYGSSYFYLSKNYILQDLNGRLKYHGVAFTGSNKCLIFDKTLDLIANATINGLLLTNVDLQNYLTQCKKLLILEPLESFVMESRVQPPDSYKTDTNIYYKLGRELEQNFGVDIQHGDEISYCKLKDGFHIIANCKKANLDFDYYKNEIYKIFKELGHGDFVKQFSHTKQHTSQHKGKKEDQSSTLDKYLRENVTSS